MFKRLVNTCDIRLGIQSTGPLLVRSGLPTTTGPDMTFVRTNRGGREEIYLPGSSLKGAIRSQAERIVRTIWGLDDPRACDPFGDQGLSRACGRHFDRDFRGGSGLNGEVAYRES